VRRLTEQARQKVNELAARHGVSTGAVMTLLEALTDSNGRMAQFHHPELGGAGQWMRGGMTLVGDMFNDALKGKVNSLCAELSGLLSRHPFLPAPGGSPPQDLGGQRQDHSGPPDVPSPGVVPPAAGGSSNWWPSEFGTPSASGGQNHLRYAYFANARRLAVDVGGHVTLYDTLDHRIIGVAQQQGGGASVTFTTPHGPVRLEDLPVVSPGGAAQAPGSPGTAPSHASASRVAEGQEIIATIEGLAELNREGILSREEFDAKKAELLRRL
jgi:hypothetical protein